MSGTRLGTVVMVVGGVLIVVGSLDVAHIDLVHTLATTLIVLGAVVRSVATEGQDETAG